MKFTDCLQQEQKKNRPTGLLFRVIDEMDPEERKDLLEALGDPNISAPTISRALKSLGYNVSDFMVKNFRQGGMSRTLESLTEEYL